MSTWALHVERGWESCITKDGVEFAMSSASKKHLQEIVSILNAHDDLVEALQASMKACVSCRAQARSVAPEGA